MASLKQQLLDAGLGLSEDDFNVHYSDLYVRQSNEVVDWLKENYEHFCNVRQFTHQVHKELWLDIPFANQDFWDVVRDEINAKQS